MKFNFAVVLLGMLFCSIHHIATSNGDPMNLNVIGIVDILTRVCKDCGMSTDKSNISLSVCDWRGFCCDTGALTNGKGTVFKNGTVSSFVGTKLGDCNAFDLSNTTSHDIKMIVSHSGILKTNSLLIPYSCVTMKFGRVNKIQMKKLKSRWKVEILMTRQLW